MNTHKLHTFPIKFGGWGGEGVGIRLSPPLPYPRATAGYDTGPTGLPGLFLFSLPPDSLST